MRNGFDASGAAEPAGAPGRANAGGTAEAAGRGDPNLRSVTSALQLLRELAYADVPLGVTEAARRLGVAPSTAHRLLSTLVASGFAMRAPEGRGYRRGPELVRMFGRRPVALVLLRDVGHPVLER